MQAPTARRGAPASREELARELRLAAEAGEAVRLCGASTKPFIPGGATRSGLELSLARLDRVVEHNAGDLTAVVEAGARLGPLQATLAEAGQMLALDPPDRGATLGGVVASGDSGPLRSRYGGVRDLVLGMTVALSDGTIARSGGKVIKNVAGYDLAKLFAGSFGTLGAIVELAVRLHPLPPARMTAVGSSRDPVLLARAASALAHSPLEPHGLDLRLARGAGTVLARFAGAAARAPAEAAAGLMREAGIAAELVEQDQPLWDAQRDGQRGRDGADDWVLRVSALQADLPELLAAAARQSALLVGRAGLGLVWLRLEDRRPDEAIATIASLRQRFSVAVLDGPLGARARVDPWGPREGPARALMQRVKDLFDPAGVLSPGVLP